MIADGWCVTYTNICLADVLRILDLSKDSALHAMRRKILVPNGTLAVATLDQMKSFNFWDCYRVDFILNSGVASENLSLLFYDSCADIISKGIEEGQIEVFSDIYYLLMDSSEDVEMFDEEKLRDLAFHLCISFEKCLLRSDAVFYWNFLKSQMLDLYTLFGGQKELTNIPLNFLINSHACLSNKERSISAILQGNREILYSKFTSRPGVVAELGSSH